MYEEYHAQENLVVRGVWAVQQGLRVGACIKPAECVDRPSIPPPPTRQGGLETGAQCCLYVHVRDSPKDKT